MSDAMVTGRMSQAKKEAGNRVLEKLGINASQLINEVYDYLIANGASPLAHPQDKPASVDPKQLADALSHVNTLAQHSEGRFAHMTDSEIKRQRLASRGLMEA